MTGLKPPYHLDLTFENDQTSLRWLKVYADTLDEIGVVWSRIHKTTLRPDVVDAAPEWITGVLAGPTGPIFILDTRGDPVEIPA